MYNEYHECNCPECCFEPDLGDYMYDDYYQASVDESEELCASTEEAMANIGSKELFDFAVSLSRSISPLCGASLGGFYVQ